VLQPVSAHPFLQLIPGYRRYPDDRESSLCQEKAADPPLHGSWKPMSSVVDIGAGTSYHAFDFFLMADHYVTVATPDPTSVLDLYRFH
jgi:flagellar biosynthesis protein FlhG